MEKFYELVPRDSHKSFYKKAIVQELNGTAYLYSYGTLICSLDLTSREFKRIWHGYSATTMRHINSFLLTFGLPAMSKTQWESIAA